jgi:hypothetical protein
MTPAELKMLADHLGHSVDIHTNDYRLQSSLLEKAKVSRLLIAIDIRQWIALYNEKQVERTRTTSY